jgi:hypothetical protein
MNYWLFKGGISNEKPKVAGTKERQHAPAEAHGQPMNRLPRTPPPLASTLIERRRTPLAEAKACVTCPVYPDIFGRKRGGVDGKNSRGGTPNATKVSRIWQEIITSPVNQDFKIGILTADGRG